jgi:hypothetical protein
VLGLMGSIGNHREMFGVIGFLESYAFSRSGEAPTARKAIS